MAVVVGILVTHFGIALLMLAGLVNAYWANEGNVQLYEGQATDEYDDYYLWEMTVSRQEGNNVVEDQVNVRAEDDGAFITSPDWPFTLRITDWARALLSFQHEPRFPPVGLRWISSHCYRSSVIPKKPAT